MLTRRMRLLGVVVAAGFVASMPRHEVKAAKGPCVVPKAWGRLVVAYPQSSASGRSGFDAVIFEDEHGTLRATNVDDCGKKSQWEIVRE